MVINDLFTLMIHMAHKCCDAHFHNYKFAG